MEATLEEASVEPPAAAAEGENRVHDGDASEDSDNAAGAGGDDDEGDGENACVGDDCAAAANAVGEDEGRAEGAERAARIAAVAEAGRAGWLGLGAPPPRLGIVAADKDDASGLLGACESPVVPSVSWADSAGMEADKCMLRLVGAVSDCWQREE